MRRRRIAGVVTLAAGIVAGPALAQETGSPAERVPPAADALPAPVQLTPEQEELAAEIESMLKCPVCRSQSVRTSRSFMAEDMSRRIRQMVAEGRTKDEIREYFVARYGDYIVLAPRKEGFIWTVWVLPFALVLGGAAGIVLVARRWKGRAPPPPPGPPSSSTSNYMQKLERELEETR
ncbi:MAG TPA: cytochrome c-type biogenesis protein [Gemmatimonadota bacterium]|nr:cytochrome c-type biogenesis protein [Gemmatimonadota bacterium]